MDTENTADAAEELLRVLASELTTPRERECLVCFLARMLTEFGCAGTLRFSLRFRDLSAPTATALRQRLEGMGAFCDCEAFLNAYEPAAHLWVVPVGAGIGRPFDREPPDLMPACAGVRRGSARPCRNWQRVRRRSVTGW